MAVKSGFFMSINGDRRYDAAFFAEYFASFIGNGVFPNPSNNLQVVEGSNMQTVVKAGKAWINGYYLHNDSDLVLQHGVAHGTMKRIDRIIVRWNVLTRQMVIEILKGTNATAPVAPTITRNTNYYDLVLADVYINAGTIQITQANITDQRLNSALCGVVTQTVKTIDTTTLFNQYQSWINQQKANYESDLAAWTASQKSSFDSWSATQKTAFTDWMAAEKSRFDTWFANLQSILNGDVVANLQNQIDQHKMDDARHNSYGTSSTAASTIAKVATRSGFVLGTGAHVAVKFTNSNTATSPTLNVNSTGAKPIFQNGTAGATWSAGEVVEFVYDGTNWCAFATSKDAIDHANNKNNPHAVTSQQVNEITELLVTDLPSAYPRGLSTFQLTTTSSQPWRDAIGNVGQTTNYAVVETVRLATSSVQRITFMYTADGTTKGTWQREAGTTSSWRSWKKVVSSDDLNPHINNAEIHRKTTFGTAEPTGGSNGDIYYQYE